MRFIIGLIVFLIIVLLGVNLLAEERFEFTLHEESRVPVSLSACDTLEQMTELIDIHQKYGIESANLLYALYNGTPNERGEPICGRVWGLLTIVKVHKTYMLDYPDGTQKPVSLVEFTMEKGTYFGITALKVRKAGKEV